MKSLTIFALSWIALLTPTAEAFADSKIAAAFSGLRLDEARRMLAAAPRDEPQVLYFLAHLAIWDHETERALSLASQCLELDGDASICHEVWGAALSLQLLDSPMFEQYGLARQSRGAWEHAVELDPTNLRARMMLLRYYRQAPWIAGGSRKKALAQERKIAQLSASRASEAKGLNLYFDGDYDAALTLFLKARAQVKDSFDPSYYVPLAAARAGDHTTGIRAFAELLEANPDDWDGWFYLGYARLKERPAINVSEQTLTDASEDIEPPSARARSLYAYGRMLEHIEEQDAARAAFAAALGADSELTEAARALDALR